jgi:hypothetical protein
VTRFFRYVQHSQIEAYRAQGWTVAHDLADCRHGAFSVLMIWEGQGEPT